MKKSTFLKTFTLFAGLLFLASSGWGQEAIASWDFENETKRVAGLPYSADVGAGTFNLVGAGPAVTWPAGTGGTGTFAVSSSNWHDGVDSKWWVIHTSTTGYSNLKISSKQQSSNTGPKDFKAQFSINGNDWYDISDITVANNFTTGVLDQLALPSACEDQSSLYLRWVVTSTTSVNSGLVASGGTSRIDDIVLVGTLTTEAPFITVAPTTLSGFTYLEDEGPSQILSFTVSGSNLTNDVTITPGADFEISSEGGENFDPITGFTNIGPEIFNAGGTKDIYVRLKAGLAVGTYNENIEITSTGADNKVVTCSGIVFEQIDWANLQWPGSGTINLGDEFFVYAQVYKEGVTDSEGQGEGIQAWIGYSTTDSDPATWTNWIEATYNTDAGNNDEYLANIGPVINDAGTYYYASRFQLGSAPFVYGGYNSGFWNETTNVSGELNVNAPYVPYYFVDFEPGNTSFLSGTTGYASGIYNLNGYQWELTQALIGSDASDMKNDAQSASVMSIIV